MDGSDSKKEFPFVIEKRHVPNVASEIFKFLDQKTLLKARLVCKEWKHQVDKKTALWKEFNCKSYKNVASPLHAAAWSGNVEMCKLLLENCDRRHSILIGDDTGQSPLHYAGQATNTFFWEKNIDLPGWQINDSKTGEYFSLSNFPCLPMYPLSRSSTLEGLLS